MQYKSSSEFAKEWNLSPRTVRNFCAKNKIPDAVYTGKQWLIPTDASKPVDMRCKNAKELSENDFYHFPVFIYSSYYSHPQDLSENERKLLKAQILHLQGKYYQSISISKELITSSIPGYLVAGAYCTIGFSSICLGLYSSYKESISKLEEILEESTYHKEDIKLLIAALITHIRWDSDALEKIDYSQLSFDTTFFFRYLLLMRSFMSGALVNDTIFKFLESELIFIEKEKITPAVFVYSSLLGTGKIYEITKEQRKAHLKRAILIAGENNWLPHFVKFYSYEKKFINEILKSIDSRYLPMINLKEKETISKWYVVKQLETGSEIGIFTGTQAEVLLLVSYGFSDTQISILMDITKYELKALIQTISEKAKIQSKADLVLYSKKLFNQIS